MEAELSEFGGMLHQWRGRHGMSQLELSTASGVSSRHISFQPVVRGQMFSWFSTLATIGTPQDVTLDELMIESLFPPTTSRPTSLVSSLPMGFPAAPEARGSAPEP
jgi:hypothetical protein